MINHFDHVHAVRLLDFRVSKAFESHSIEHFKAFGKLWTSSELQSFWTRQSEAFECSKCRNREVISNLNSSIVQPLIAFLIIWFFSIVIRAESARPPWSSRPLLAWWCWRTPLELIQLQTEGFGWEPADLAVATFNGVLMQREPASRAPGLSCRKG